MTLLKAVISTACLAHIGCVGLSSAHATKYPIVISHL
jgi:hypothetical protein